MNWGGLQEWSVEQVEGGRNNKGAREGDDEVE